MQDSAVRVATNGGHGTGFFVKGPAGNPLIVSALHVLQGGSGDITATRVVALADGTRYEESYRARIVAQDEDADLVILELPGVPADKQPALALAEQVEPGEIVSSGFGQSLLGQLGLLEKPGRILTSVKLPVVDPVTGRVRKLNATRALVVTSELEPGFSGGPTVSTDGEVVGVNMLKDRVHQGQNGVVHVAEVRELLASVRPAAPLSKASVSEFLRRLVAEYFELSIGERMAASEGAFVRFADQANVLTLVDGLRSQDRGLGLRFELSAMPGRMLPMFGSSEVQTSISECARKAGLINNLLSGIAVPRPDDCSPYGARALTWDLAAATMRWTGRHVEYVVTQVEEVDPEQRLYMARVRTGDDPSSVINVPLVYEGGRPKLRLFEPDGQIYAVRTNGSLDPSGLVSRWSRRESGVGNETTTSQVTESLVISMDGVGGAVVAHEHTTEWRARAGFSFSCLDNALTTVDKHMQSFAGRMKEGVVISFAQEVPLARTGDRRTERCGQCPSHKRDMAAMFKLLAPGRLIMARTDGARLTEVDFKLAS